MGGEEPNGAEPAEDRRIRSLTAARRLMGAILEDALLCYGKYMLATTGAKRKQFLAAEQWLFGSCRGAIVSFEDACDVLGLERRHIRQLVLRWRDDVRLYGVENGGNGDLFRALRGHRSSRAQSGR
jgi:hypothetical protein